MKYIVDYILNGKFRTIIVEANNREEIKHKAMEESQRLDGGIPQRYSVFDMYGKNLYRFIIKSGIPNNMGKKGRKPGYKINKKIYVYDIETMHYVDCYDDAEQFSEDMGLSACTIRNKIGLFPNGVRIDLFWITRKKIEDHKNNIKKDSIL